MNILLNKIKGKFRGDKDSINNILLYAFIFLSTLFYNFQYTNIYNSGFKILLLLSYFFAGGYIILNYSLKQLINIGLISAVIFIFFRWDTRALTLLLYVILLSNTHIVNKSFKIIFFQNILFLLFILIFAYNPSNALGLLIGTTIMQYFVLYNINLSLKGLICSSLCIFGIYILIDSAQFLVCMLMFFVLYYMTKKQLLDCFFKNIALRCIHSFAFFFNLFFARSLNFSQKNIIGKLFHSVAVSLDKLMSYRLSLTNGSLTLFSFKLWGRTVDVNHPALANQYFYIDSGYVQILQNQGLIVVAFVLFIMYLMMNYLYKNKYFNLFVVGIILAMWAINEDILLSIRINFLFLYLGVAIRDILQTICKKWGKTYEI